MLRLQLDRYRPGTRQAPHDHDTLHLSLVLCGGITELVGGAGHVGTPLSVVWKDPGVRHADTFAPEETRMARLSVPAHGLTQLLDDGRQAPAFRWMHDPRVARPFLHLLTRFPAQAAFEVADDDVSELLSLLSGRPAGAGVPPRWLQRVVERVADEPATVTTGALARDAGVHPVYLARALRRWYGVSLRDLRSSGKLRHAAAHLTHGRATHAAVAASAGFSDEAHLSHTFRRLVGTTPGAFRRIAQHTPP